MRQFILFMFLSFSINAQSYETEPIEFEIGYYIRPIIYYHPSVFLDEYSLIPILDFTIGTKDKRFFISLGNNSMAGFRINTKYIYVNAYYIVCLFNRDLKLKHGVGLDIGFNYRFNSGSNFYTFYIGLGVGLLGRFDANYLEANFMPLNIGLSLRLKKSDVLRIRHTL